MLCNDTWMSNRLKKQVVCIQYIYLCIKVSTPDIIQTTLELHLVDQDRQLLSGCLKIVLDYQKYAQKVCRKI